MTAVSPEQAARPISWIGASGSVASCRACSKQSGPTRTAGKPVARQCPRARQLARWAPDKPSFIHACLWPSQWNETAPEVGASGDSPLDAEADPHLKSLFGVAQRLRGRRISTRLAKARTRCSAAMAARDRDEACEISPDIRVKHAAVLNQPLDQHCAKVRLDNRMVVAEETDRVGHAQSVDRGLNDDHAAGSECPLEL